MGELWNRPLSAWLLLVIVVIDRSLSIFLGIERDVTSHLVDLAVIGGIAALVLTASRIIWSIMAILFAATMALMTMFLVNPPVPLDQLSNLSILHIVFGYAGLVLLVLNPQLLKWV